MRTLLDVARLRDRRTGRCSSWDVKGRNQDFWTVPAGATRVLADLRGPGVITHLWMTQADHYRDCLLKITWDDAAQPSVLCPLGDFFCLGHGLVNSFQSLLFTVSTSRRSEFGGGSALNAYVPMPFRRRALVELVNESGADHMQYFYVDYELCDERELEGLGCFHAEFRRTNPFSGWAPEILVNTSNANSVNVERTAWTNNYVILETRGRGHYLGCNLSVTNLQGTWWGEGDDMIWVDGYKWPPDLHGTGSEDYLNQAWGMQPNAFLRNGSSIFEGDTIPKAVAARGLRSGVAPGGHQTSYVFHLENPVRFQREIKVTIEHGHGNHLGNEMSSVAYWYAAEPAPAIAPPPVRQRQPVLRDARGNWIRDPAAQCPGPAAQLTEEMRGLRAMEATHRAIRARGTLSPWHSPFVTTWKISRRQPARDLATIQAAPRLAAPGWKTLKADPRFLADPWLVNAHGVYGDADGLVYLAGRFRVAQAGEWILHVGHDGGVKVFVDGAPVLTEPTRVNPAPHTRSRARLPLDRGSHEIVIALDLDEGRGWGIHCCFEIPEARRKRGVKPVFPVPMR